ncbi:SPOR domain-containing protein [Oxalobacter aliiformigenes]|uniref:SPOR domain-containing protein n=1 Tax=Oxalobacter aliiformigenes TaxID=2946593 RepID=UPI0022AF3C4A|nr:SPOR domain-containing protein [Oxalobacter aliiformigenes]MCZ4064882.1 SPOR domain-containing protein [Oxalobacter aliiformigenes]WAV98992.1 SPOR domain-containing protein [Oxalobacter aliiformigenes]
MATSKKQKSGIVSGFIIGLITGLVIAVIVAFMVTKTPIPFAGRKDRPASTPTPAVAGASASDPNQSLYGKETPRPTLPVTADNPANTSAQQTVAATSPQMSPEEKTACYLQAGAFRNRNEAENMRGNLALLGFESHISETLSNSGIIYRVRLGPYKGNTASNVQNKLKQNGINTTVTRAVKQ